MATDKLKLEGTGRLVHHFWGDYCADVVIDFKTDAAGVLALAALAPLGFKPAKQPRAVQWTGRREALDVLKAALPVKIRPCGRKECRGQCKDQPIDGTAHSIDAGPLFEVVVSVENPAQLSL